MDLGDELEGATTDAVAPPDPVAPARSVPLSAEPDLLVQTVGLSFASALRQSGARVEMMSAGGIAEPAAPDSAPVAVASPSAGTPADTLAETPARPWLPEYVPITVREREVLVLVAGGLTNREIASRLSLSVKTAMHHTTAIYRKLGLRGRAEATAYAYRHGLIS